MTRLATIDIDSVKQLPTGEVFYPVAAFTPVGAYGSFVVNAAEFAGATAGQKIQAALTAVAAAGGGTVDARGLTGAQVIDVDLLANVTAEVPLKVIFGPAQYSCQQGNANGIVNLWGSQLEFNLNGTVITLSDGQNQTGMFKTSAKGQATSGVSVVNGSAVITIPALSGGVIPKVGKSISIFGHLPAHGGRDNTTLNGAIDGSQTTGITLTSEAAVTIGASSKYIRIDNEIISYTGVAANVLSGVTRGARGSTAAPHADQAAVDRVVYDCYLMIDVTGSGPWTVTLDRPVTLAPTMTAVDANVGPSDVLFSGCGVLDGNKPASDTSANGAAITFQNGQGLKVERGITFRHWDHIGVQTTQSQHCVVDGKFEYMGWPDLGLGFTVLFFNGSKYCTAYGDYAFVNHGPAADDRSTLPTFADNACIGIVFAPRTIRNCWRGHLFEGTINSRAYLPYIENWNYGSHGAGTATQLSGPQWVTAPNVTGNVVDLGVVTPAGSAIGLVAPTSGFNIIRSWTAGVVASSIPSGNLVAYVDASGVWQTAGVVGDQSATRFIAVTSAGASVGAQLGQNGQAKLNLDGVDATFAAGEMGIGETNGNLRYVSRGSHVFANATSGLDQFSITNAGLVNTVSGAYQRGGVQVVGARKTGYTNLMTGTPNRATAYDTSTITLQQLAERVKALEDDLHSVAGHGLIGP